MPGLQHHRQAHARADQPLRQAAWEATALNRATTEVRHAAEFALARIENAGRVEADGCPC